MGGFDIRRLVRNCAKILTCGFLSALVTYPIMKILGLLILDTSYSLSVFFLVLITIALYSASYLFFVWLFNVEEIYLLGKLFLKIKHIRKKITEVYTDVA
jgi:hypothetical protein